LVPARDAEEVANQEDAGEELIEEVDPAPSFVETEVGTPPEPDAELVDFGPAEMEIDLEVSYINTDKSEAAYDESADDEDAATEAAVREAHDDWFYRETYGYGPRYDYDLYGYEEYITDQSNTGRELAGDSAASAEIASLPEGAFPWDYVYRLELGEIADDLDSSPRTAQIPFAPAKQAKYGPLKLTVEEPTPAEHDPSLPASSDFDPAALISSAKGIAQELTTRQVLTYLHKLTPMELARMALAAAPDCSRPARSVLVSPKSSSPQAKLTDLRSEPSASLRELAMFLDDAGQALLMLSHRVEALADATSTVNPAGPVTPLQSRIPADVETR
jgi:hypothetical protein